MLRCCYFLSLLDNLISGQGSSGVVGLIAGAAAAYSATHGHGHGGYAHGGYPQGGYQQGGYAHGGYGSYGHGHGHGKFKHGKFGKHKGYGFKKWK